MRASSRPLLRIPLRMARHRLLELILTPSVRDRTDPITGDPARFTANVAPAPPTPWGLNLIIAPSTPSSQSLQEQLVLSQPYTYNCRVHWRTAKVAGGGRK